MDLRLGIYHIVVDFLEPVNDVIVDDCLFRELVGNLVLHCSQGLPGQSYEDTCDADTQLFVDFPHNV